MTLFSDYSALFYLPEDMFSISPIYLMAWEPSSSVGTEMVDPNRPRHWLKVGVTEKKDVSKYYQ